MPFVLSPRQASYPWLSTSYSSLMAPWKYWTRNKMRGLPGDVRIVQQDVLSEFSQSRLGLWWWKKLLSPLRAQLVFWVMHQQTTPEVYLLAPLRGKCRFMMCANTQMAYFQLHHPTTSLVKELLADLRPEHSEDWKVTSGTSRLAALCWDQETIKCWAMLLQSKYLKLQKTLPWLSLWTLLHSR